MTYSLLGIREFATEFVSIVFCGQTQGFPLIVLFFTLFFYLSLSLATAQLNRFVEKVWKIKSVHRMHDRQSVFYFVTQTINELVCKRATEAEIEWEKERSCSFEIMNLISELSEINELILSMWLVLDFHHHFFLSLCCRCPYFNGFTLFFLSLSVKSLFLYLSFIGIDYE